MHIQNDSREKYIIVIPAVGYLTGTLQCLGLVAIVDLKYLIYYGVS